MRQFSLLGELLLTVKEWRGVHFHSETLNATSVYMHFTAS